MPQHMSETSHRRPLGHITDVGAAMASLHINTYVMSIGAMCCSAVVYLQLTSASERQDW
jgi:hypothetical protein